MLNINHIFNITDRTERIVAIGDLFFSISTGSYFNEEEIACSNEIIVNQLFWIKFFICEIDDKLKTSFKFLLEQATSLDLISTETRIDMFNYVCFVSNKFPFVENFRFDYIEEIVALCEHVSYIIDSGKNLPEFYYESCLEVFFRCVTITSNIRRSVLHFHSELRIVFTRSLTMILDIEQNTVAKYISFWYEFNFLMYKNNESFVEITDRTSLGMK